MPSTPTSPAASAQQAPPPGAKARTTVSLDAELLAAARELVSAGRAESTSALIEHSLREQIRAGQLEELLDELDRLYGTPSAEAQSWAAEVVKSLRSS